MKSNPDPSQVFKIRLMNFPGAVDIELSQHINGKKVDHGISSLGFEYSSPFFPEICERELKLICTILTKVNGLLTHLNCFEKDAPLVEETKCIIGRKDVGDIGCIGYVDPEIILDSLK